MNNYFTRILLAIIISIFFMQYAMAQTSITTRVKEVIVVFKTHFDIGYTDWSDNVRYNYANSMVTSALNTIAQSKSLPKDQQFKWTVSGWPMKEMLLKSKPEVKAKIEKAIKDGNLFVHALPFSMETE